MPKYTAYTIDPITGQYVKVSTSSGGSGINYSDLEGVPVVDVRGRTEESFINIAGLDYGIYRVSGYYKYDGSSELLNTGAEFIQMIITTDTETGKKVAIYETSENYDVIQNIIIYSGSNVEKVVRQGPGTYWGAF